MEIRPLIHKVQYYETDMMGVTHHANYIHWMEEARIDLKALRCSYLRPTTFGDEIRVLVSVLSFNGVVITLRYAMKNEKDETVCEAESEHVFLNREGKFVRLKRQMPEFCAKIESLVRPA